MGRRVGSWLCRAGEDLPRVGDEDGDEDGDVDGDVDCDVDWTSVSVIPDIFTFVRLLWSWNKSLTTRRWRGFVIVVLMELNHQLELEEPDERTPSALSIGKGREARGSPKMYPRMRWTQVISKDQGNLSKNTNEESFSPSKEKVRGWCMRVMQAAEVIWFKGHTLLHLNVSYLSCGLW